MTTADGAPASRRLSLAWICLLLGLLGTLPLILLTPPLQVPDEGQHFLRAYQLSEMRIWSHVDADAVGDDLPASLRTFIVRFLGTAREHADRSVTPQPLSQTLAGPTLPLDPNDRRFIAFQGSAFYAPPAYLPQAAAIAAGRAFGAGPLLLFYLGRLANAVVALAVVALAVRIVPYGRELMLIAALLPMALYQYASLSPDAAVIACAFLYTAIALRAQAAAGWRLSDIVAAVATGAVFCSLKPVYLPLLLVGLLPDLFDKDRRGPVLGAHALIVVAVGGSTWLWMRSTASAFTLPRSGTSLSGQVAFILAHPASYARILADTLQDHGLFYLQSTIGVFGWLTILPAPMLALLPAIAAALTFLVQGAARPRVSRVSALWQMALVCACGLLVLTSLYLIWTPVGAPMIDGVQGRYFLPLLGASAVAASRLWPATLESGVAPQRLVAMLVIIGIGQALLTDLTIVKAYAVL